VLNVAKVSASNVTAHLLSLNKFEKVYLFDDTAAILTESNSVAFASTVNDLNLKIFNIQNYTGINQEFIDLQKLLLKESLEKKQKEWKEQQLKRQADKDREQDRLAQLEQDSLSLKPNGANANNLNLEQQNQNNQNKRTLRGTRSISYDQEEADKYLKTEYKPTLDKIEETTEPNLDNKQDSFNNDTQTNANTVETLDKEKEAEKVVLPEIDKMVQFVKDVKIAQDQENEFIQIIENCKLTKTWKQELSDKFAQVLKSANETQVTQLNYLKAQILSR